MKTSPPPLLGRFRRFGHDVVRVGTVAPGSSDQDVLTWTARDGRILLTFDKDFNELARNAALPSICGVLLLRVPMPGPGDVGARLADLGRDA